jgi:hypothetical protein
MKEYSGRIYFLTYNFFTDVVDLHWCQRGSVPVFGYGSGSKNQIIADPDSGVSNGSGSTTLQLFYI